MFPSFLRCSDVSLIGLQANLLTGVVNLSLQTMYASDAVALVVLSTYVGVVCGVAWLLRGVRLLRF
jgi:glucosaminylphosphatidylinositol acyltransferase